jgi:hypothetical protein
MTRAGKQHVVFLAALAVGLVLRTVAILGNPSVLWFGGDSGTYLQAALHLRPYVARPSGYSVFLFLLRPFHSMTLVAAVQHLLGLATAVMIYALVWRAAARISTPWKRSLLGTAAAAPVLLDGYQIELEHLLMADELFVFLAVAALTVLFWKPPTWRTMAVTGALLAAAALTRSVGLPLLVIVLAWLLVRRAGWRPMVSGAVAFAVPVLGYMFWFQAVHHTFGITRTDSIWLYGRTAVFADCGKMHPPADLRPLCPGPPEPGVAPSQTVLWGRTSPLRAYPGGIGGVEANQKAGDFAWLAIKSQPLDYLRVVAHDTLRAFAPGHDPYPTRGDLVEYHFPVHPRPVPARNVHIARRYDHSAGVARTVRPFAGWIRGYQDVVFLPGPLLGAIVLTGLGGIVVRRREWGGQATLPWLFAMALLVVPAATADFDYRYVLPAVPFACLAAALAVTAPSPRSSAESGHDDADRGTSLHTASPR